MRRPAYNPALDGVRAIAVLAVFLFHVDVLRAGYLGVDVFFVLSGFLITGLLLVEHDQRGAISIGAFYLRRAYRLLPAFYVYVAIGAALVLALKGEQDRLAFFGNALTSLLYVNNYFRVFHDDPGAWFEHTWSLSVEEQFYLVWPLCLILLCRLPSARRYLAPIILVGAIGVLGWRLLLVASGASFGRIYFGIDTRADALLIGCALAAWKHARFAFDPLTGHERAMPPQLLRALNVIGPVSLLALLGWMVAAPSLSGITWMQRAGFSAMALLAGGLVLSTDSQNSARWTRLLGWAPLSSFGRISYGFYLWHLAPSAIANAQLAPRFGKPAAVVIAGLGSYLLAAASYRFVEAPLQRRRPVSADPLRVASSADSAEKPDPAALIT